MEKTPMTWSNCRCSCWFGGCCSCWFRGCCCSSYIKVKVHWEPFIADGLIRGEQDSKGVACWLRVHRVHVGDWGEGAKGGIRGSVIEGKLDEVVGTLHVHFCYGDEELAVGWHWHAVLAAVGWKKIIMLSKCFIFVLMKQLYLIRATILMQTFSLRTDKHSGYLRVFGLKISNV